MTSKKPKKSKIASVISGSASGALVSACVQPLDVIRTRIQADSARGQFIGVADTVKSIVKAHGVRALWQGTQPTVVRLGIGAGLHFFFLETLKPMFESTSTHELGAMGALLTGGLSRAMAAVVSCPITVVKTRMEFIDQRAGMTQPYTNTLHALQTIARTEGIRGLYKGLGPTILSNTPFSGLYYLFYTRLQNQLRMTDMPGVAVNLCSSTVAAVAATLITQPADVVRTRMQLNLAHAEAVAPASWRFQTWSMLQSIAKTQGMKGLLAGAGPRMVKRTLQTALVWTLYEELAPRLSYMVHYVIGDGRLRKSNITDK